MNSSLILSNSLIYLIREGLDNRQRLIFNSLVVRIKTLRLLQLYTPSIIVSILVFSSSSKFFSNSSKNKVQSNSNDAKNSEIPR